MPHWKMNRRGYPLHEDIKQAIREALTKGDYPPFKLCEEVAAILKRKGFYTGHINVKKVWKLYLEVQKENLTFNQPV
ncbi:MAG: hypothetical protein RQ952_03705 [Thermoproteota archaeon]|jgi:hypothetical protein|nr:hypothetical protein [Thermoproteota archaeon]